MLNLIILIFILLFLTIYGKVLNVNLLAGGYISGLDNGVGSNARFSNPSGISISSDDSFALITEISYSKIRKLIISTGIVSNFIGGGSSSTTAGNIDGIGTNALFYGPFGVTISSDSSFAYVSDSINQNIRKITISTSEVSTLAGSSQGNLNGIGTNARFSNPYGLTLSSDSTYLLVSDFNNHLIRKIILSTIEVSTLAGGSTSGSIDGIGTNALFNYLNDISMSPDGTYTLIVDYNNHIIRKMIISTLQVSTVAGSSSVGLNNGIGTNSKFFSPFSICISSDGVYALVTETGFHLIRKIILSTSLVSTVAGGGTFLNGIGTNVAFYNPTSISLSSNGNYALIADSNNHLIRKLDISSNLVTRIAGRTYFDLTIGTNAFFNSPSLISYSKNGSFALFCDTSYHIIRKVIISTGLITTIAGGFQSGNIDGIGTNALFNQPIGISVSNNDDNFALISDSNNHRIRKIILSTSEVSTLAGGSSSGNTNGIGTNARFNNPCGIIISPDNSYSIIADSNNHQIRKIILSTLEVSLLSGSSSGFRNGIGTIALFNNPYSISFIYSHTSILISDRGNNLIREMKLSTNEVTTIAGKFLHDPLIGTNAIFSKPYMISISSDGSFAIISDNSYHIIRQMIISTNLVTTIAGTITSGTQNGIGTNALFNSPWGVSISPDKSYVLVSDANNNRIRKIILSNNIVTTFVGSSSGNTNGIGTNAKFNNPAGIIISPDSTYALVCDSGNHRIRKIQISTLSVTTFVGSSSGTSNGIGTNSRFNSPQDITITQNGNYAFIADRSNNLIRQITISTSSVNTLAGGSTSGTTNGIGSNALFNSPSGLFVSPDGNYLLVSTYSSNMIRKVEISTFSVTLFAGSTTSDNINGIGSNARFNNPRGITISPDGIFSFVIDENNKLIRKIEISTSSVSTIAGGGSINGIGTNAQFNNPYGLAVHPNENYAFIADSSNNQIRQIILSTNEVSVAGGSTASGNTNGVGTNAKFNNPRGLSISPDGNTLLIADSGNNYIRQALLYEDPTMMPTIAPTSPTTSPTILPSNSPTFQPSSSPSYPTYTPSYHPTYTPSSSPTSSPTYNPTYIPTSSPTTQPSSQPTSPTNQPTGQPTMQQTSESTLDELLPNSSKSKQDNILNNSFQLSMILMSFFLVAIICFCIGFFCHLHLKSFKNLPFLGPKIHSYEV